MPDEHPLVTIPVPPSLGGGCDRIDAAIAPLVVTMWSAGWPTLGVCADWDGLGTAFVLLDNGHHAVELVSALPDPALVWVFAIKHDRSTAHLATGIRAFAVAFPAQQIPAAVSDLDRLRSERRTTKGRSCHRREGRGR